jgi:L-asparaginase II
MSKSAILFDKTRGSIVESSVTGHVVVINKKGTVKFYGEPKTFTYIRSASKPFQTIPLITTGAYKHFNLNAKHLAVASGSHSGQHIHRKLIMDMLDRADLNESHLHCGTHRPFTKVARIEVGDNPSPLSHNCSGKHTAMLLVCKHMGWDIDDYMNPNHPVQTLMKTEVASMFDINENQIETGIDGCGVPVFAMPLTSMAKGYFNLCNSNHLPYEKREAVNLIRDAIQSNPTEFAGDYRIATLFLKDNPRCIFKAGAEGIGCFGGENIGCTFKIDCGDEAHLFAFVASKIAEALGYNINNLVSFSNEDILNYNDQVVGHRFFRISGLLDH